MGQALSSDTPWMRYAAQELGVSEIEGEIHNDRILEYLKTADNLGEWAKNRDETAWCAVFVSWCLEQAGYPSTRHGLAASYLSYGVELDEGRRGAIAVIRNRRKAARKRVGSLRGNHVGFVTKKDDDHIWLLGGNQSNQVKVARFSLKTWELRGLRWPEPG